MKLLTVTVPCYNSQDYMHNCIQSLLPAGDEVEIIIVNDGSTDKTAEIAEGFAKEYPNIIKVINKENGGHGSAVNAGIAAATGLFFKVVDSDDWVDIYAYKKVMNLMRRASKRSVPLDLIITNYIYDNNSFTHKKGMNFRGMLPENRVFSWDNVRHFFKGNYMLMHALTYRTEVLRKSGVKLLEHTFYVDNIYAYVPMPYVKTMYYMSVDFYHYFIGRADQSVNESNMVARLDQQIRVNKYLLDHVDLDTISSKKLRQYMFNYLEIITAVSNAICLVSGTEENLRKRDELWEYIKNKDEKIYRKLRRGLIGIGLNLPGKNGQKISVGLYHFVQNRIGFN